MWCFARVHYILYVHKANWLLGELIFRQIFVVQISRDVSDDTHRSFEPKCANDAFYFFFDSRVVFVL